MNMIQKEEGRQAREGREAQPARRARKGREGRQKKKGREAWVLGALVLVAAGLWLWPALKGREPVAATSAETETAPAASVQDEADDRARACERDREALRAIADDEALPDETREEAAKRLTDLVERRQRELALNDLIAALGYAPCLTLEQNGSVTVLLAQDAITEDDSAALLALCLAHMPVARENVRIMTGGGR